ncbi:hypothetical protein Anapl_05348 [Anas platyrhynchos]|uniref:C2H2-type domain-containing protein n=1 Tax=Anas platyrhynchos TaxID=8839 RepID=R0K058_ANAPL|nr:hypothetical protein Anapl_05348 [Anas platyrhynchos]
MLVILPAATAQAALSGSSETMTCWTSQCPRVLCGAVAVSEHLLASHGSDAPLTVELLCYWGRALVLQAERICDSKLIKAFWLGDGDASIIQQNLLISRLDVVIIAQGLPVPSPVYRCKYSRVLSYARNSLCCAYGSTTELALSGEEHKGPETHLSNKLFQPSVINDSGLLSIVFSSSLICIHLIILRTQRAGEKLCEEAMPRVMAPHSLSICEALLMPAPRHRVLVKGLISRRTSSGIMQILLVFLQTFLQLAGTGSTQGAGALVISQSCRNSLESRDCVQGWVQGVSWELPGTDRCVSAQGRHGCHLDNVAWTVSSNYSLDSSHGFSPLARAAARQLMNPISFCHSGITQLPELLHKGENFLALLFATRSRVPPPRDVSPVVINDLRSTYNTSAYYLWKRWCTAQLGRGEDASLQMHWSLLNERECGFAIKPNADSG